MKYVRPILVGGLVAGALDIVYAIAVWGAQAGGAAPILQSIASGVLGKAAYSGGMQTALLGGALHFAITIAMAAAFVVAARYLPVLVRSPIVTGAVYGVGLYAVMNYVVVPLSAVGRDGPPEGWRIAVALFPHIAFVGIPIALIARRYLGPGARISAKR